MGAGAGATIIGELTRITGTKSRTAVFSVFMAMRQIGLVIGPAFNLFLRKCSFKLGPYAVSKLTAPGVSWLMLSVPIFQHHYMQAFMVIVWTIIEMLFLVDLFISLFVSAVRPAYSDENTSLVTEKAPSMQKTSSDSTHSPEGSLRVWWSMRIWSLIQEQIVILLAVLFVTMFNQTSIEVSLC